jgi:hypothetical protein
LAIVGTIPWRDPVTLANKDSSKLALERKSVKQKNQITNYTLLAQRALIFFTAALRKKGHMEVTWRD